MVNVIGLVGLKKNPGNVVNGIHRLQPGDMQGGVWCTVLVPL